MRLNSDGKIDTSTVGVAEAVLELNRNMTITHAPPEAAPPEADGGDYHAPYETIEHPQHYGGDTPYETIKVIEAWGYGPNFHIANVIKYLSRAGQKPGVDMLEDMKKARWYLDRAIKLMTPQTEQQ